MNQGDVAARVDAALREEEPATALHAVVHSLLRAGHRRREIGDALEEYRKRLIAQGRQGDDELVLDILAVLDGHASATAVRRLLPPPCVAPQASSLG